MAAEFLLKKLNNKGNVVELEGVPGSSSARERGEGFHKVIDKEKGIKIVAKQPADFNRSKGLSVMENIIQGHKNIDAVFAQNDEMALGAVQALKSAGLKDVVVVGFDGTDDGLKAVKDGSMTATIAQQPVLIGQKAVETAVKVVDGKDVKKTIPVPLELKTGK
jgi:ribose transport system substrate-binding protein